MVTVCRVVQLRIGSAAGAHSQFQYRSSAPRGGVAVTSSATSRHVIGVPTLLRYLMTTTTERAAASTWRVPLAGNRP